MFCVSPPETADDFEVSLFNMNCRTAAEASVSACLPVLRRRRPLPLRRVLLRPRSLARSLAVDRRLSFDRLTDLASTAATAARLAIRLLPPRHRLHVLRNGAWSRIENPPIFRLKLHLTTVILLL